MAARDPMKATQAMTMANMNAELMADQRSELTRLAVFFLRDCRGMTGLAANPALSALHDSRHAHAAGGADRNQTASRVGQFIEQRRGRS